MAFQQVYPNGGEAVLDKLQDLCIVGRKGLYRRTSGMQSLSLCTKSREKKSDSSNYRGITLLSIAGKILVRVLLNRLIPTIAQENTPESQCGFRSNRGTADMIFVLRQIQEKCREQNMGLYAALIQSAVMDCGKSWLALAVPKNFSPSSDSCREVSTVR